MLFLNRLHQLLAVSVIGVAAGLASALFLVTLDFVTRLHWGYPALLFLLPVAGILSASIYARWGQQAETGTNLILNAIHQPDLHVPGRMAPLVLLGTLITHLCGGSAGREGTAVQMGGSLAAAITRLLRLPSSHLPLLLKCGVAAGFGAVFGTPFAGAIFAVEAPAAGRISLSLRPILLCLIAALIADRGVTALGIKHTLYTFPSESTAAITDTQPLLVQIGTTREVILLAKTAIAAVAFGCAARFFVLLTTFTRHLLQLIPAPGWCRPAIGGTAVVALALILGDHSYLGLGVSASPLRPGDVSIESCFTPGGAHWFSWFWKLLFTALTVGSGFKGGEVTPLFFIGAALGNVLAEPLGIPVSHLAAFGFVSVFAAAARTPLACTIMAIEIFAPANPGLLTTSFLISTALCAFLANRCSSPNGIYRITLPAKPLDSHP